MMCSAYEVPLTPSKVMEESVYDFAGAQALNYGWDTDCNLVYEQGNGNTVFLLYLNACVG